MDLIVLGSHGRTGLKRALLGSVPERVVLLVEVPLPQQVYDQVLDTAKKGIDQRVAKVVAEGVKVDGSVICESPTRAILEAAAKRQADLIVMGTHGRTGMKHVLIGSVAEHAVRLAPCPS